MLWNASGVVQGKLAHKNVLNLLAVAFEGDDWLLVTDLCERKSALARLGRR